MNRYKKLTLNTLIMAIGTMGSKVIALLMLPFYTNILTTAEYGTIDLLLQTGNFLIPICTLGITAGIIRFGLDDTYKRRDVFTTGIVSLGIGFSVCSILALLAAWVLSMPFVSASSQVDSIQQYLIWILILLLSASLHSICGAFVRSREMVRLYAITGILNTICNVLLMILFLRGLRLGVTGYMLAVITADLISVLFLTTTSRLWRFIRPTHFYNSTFKSMLKFSMPLIPAIISWWIINMSDRFMIWAMISESANGIYSVAAKIPSIVTILASVFIDAWQISIISTKSKLEQSRFYSGVFKSYQALLFLMAGFVTLLAKPIISFMTTPAYYEAGDYIPLLLSATVFSCLAVFVGSIYTVEKRSVSQLITTLIGSVINIVLNALLLPRIGILGASISTFISFLLVFIIRMIDTRRYIKLNWSPMRFIISCSLLLIQTSAVFIEWGSVYIIQSVCFIGLIIINLKPVLSGARKMLRSRKKSSSASR